MNMLTESLPFLLFTNPSVINQFTFGHWVDIYYEFLWMFAGNILDSAILYETCLCTFTFWLFMEKAFKNKKAKHLSSLLMKNNSL